MSRFTHCPGEDCTAKVKITEDLPDGVEEINFCCVLCFQYTWAHMLGLEDPHEHSEQCRTRQMSRLNERVVEGEFKIHTPKVAPPSRLGGNGGPTVS